MLATLEISRCIGGYIFLRNSILEDSKMKHVICPVCGNICIKYGNNKSGSQRWICKKCNERIGEPMQYDNSFKQEAIELSDEIGVRKATEQLGIPYYTLADW